MKKHAWWIELFLIAVIAFAGSRLLMYGIQRWQLRKIKDDD